MIACSSKYYYLMPRPEQNQKSFCGKAFVEQCFEQDELKSETLYSYGIPIIRVYANGKMERLWDDWSYTTGKHIYAFCQLHKNEFEKVEKVN